MAKDIKTLAGSFVSATELAGWIGTSRQAVSQLADRGVLDRGPRGFELQASIRAYAHFQRQASRGSDEVRQAKAAEIRQRMAIRDRKIIALDEALDCVTELAGMVRAELEGLPASFTRDLALRRQLEQRVHHILDRLAQRCRDGAAALTTGKV